MLGLAGTVWVATTPKLAVSQVLLIALKFLCEPFGMGQSQAIHAYPWGNRSVLMDSFHDSGLTASIGMTSTGCCNLGGLHALLSVGYYVTI